MFFVIVAVVAAVASIDTAFHGDWKGAALCGAFTVMTPIFYRASFL